MKIKIRLYGVLRDYVGRETLELEKAGSSIELHTLFKDLLDKYERLREYIVVEGDTMRVRSVSILVNGRHVMFVEGEKTQLKDGDIIDLIPPVAGGCGYFTSWYMFCDDLAKPLEIVCSSLTYSI